MLEALVDVALRAVLASVVLGGILALGVLAATRALALTASTRHALWTTALLATAIMPLAGIGMSWAKAAPAPTAAVAPPDAAAPATAWSAPHHPATYAPSPVPPPASNGWTATVRLLAERLGATVAAAERTPRLTHTLALGVIGAWLLGAAIGLAGLVASLLRVRGLKKRSSPLDGELADELPWLTETRDGREIYLRLSYETETPVAIGFGRPVILIPTELATADGLAAIESLVLHEYAHLRRYDDWTNLVQRVVERIFWFNPVVWIVGRRIALEREIASDDAVVERTGAAHAYATSLWRLAREMRMPEHAVVAPGALLTRKQISVRIEQLLDKNRARLHRSPAAAVGAAFAAALAVGVVATSAPAVELPAAAHEAVAATSPSPASPQAAAPAHAATQPHAAAHQPMSPHEAALAKRLAAAEHQLAQRAADARRQRSEAHVEKRVIILADTTAAPSLASLPPIPPTPKTPAMPATPPTPPTPPTPSSSHDTRVMIKKLSDTRTMVGIDIGSIVHDAMTTSAAAARSAQVAQAGADAPSMHGRNVDGMKLTREMLANCMGCSARGADLRGLDLHGIRLTGMNLRGADMRGVNLAGAKLMGVSLSGANLAGADLRGTQLNGVELRGADLSDAQLEDVKLYGISFRSVNLRGTALRSAIANCVGCDFGGMDLHDQDLHGITLHGANFSHADLHNANLTDVAFVGVNLGHANLAGADLTGASFNGCDLRGTNRAGIRTGTGGLRVTASDID